MKAYTSPEATPFVISNALNTPNRLGSNDYFASSHKLAGAQVALNQLEEMCSGIEEGGLFSKLQALQHTPVVSLTDSLPNELLVLILEFGYFDFSEGPIPHTQFRSLMLQTSRKFRQLTLHTPSLWSIICLSQSNVGQELEHLPVYLERSAQYPLDIQLSCLWDADVTDAVLGYLVPHSKHWRRLSIVTVNNYILSLLQDVHVPILEDLDISFFSHERRVRLPSPTFNDNTPRLTHLCLRNIDIDTLNIPLHGVKTLEIRGYGTWPTISRLREMLDGPLALEKLILHVKPSQVLHQLQVDEGREQSQSQIHLPALRVFEVYSSEWLTTRIVSLVRTFSCPKLESFVLREGVGSASEAARTIMRYTPTAHRHKDPRLYGLLEEELCTGHPNRMFVQSASVYLACQTMSASMLTSLELRKPFLLSLPTTKAMFSSLKNLKHLYFLDTDPNALVRQLLDIEELNQATSTSLSEMASTIAIPSLETFVLEVYHGYDSFLAIDHTDVFIDVFDLPSLRSLTLKNLDSYPLLRVASSFAKKAAVYTQLTSLKLIDIKDVIRTDPGLLFACSFPHLRRLTLDCVSSNAFIHQLLPSSSAIRGSVPSEIATGSLPWPNVEELSVCNDTNVSKPLLHRVISARKDLGKPLQKLYLDEQFESNIDSWNWLHEQVDVGLAQLGFL